ncbi:polysaccharide biosynthesis tyrosine autokinase [Aureimonas frigidaquae]|uniref:polysaccharide biosynthesis tyrosine autokinase n=1 Tax=Aureimonas frigidaquae TaxID=424757 RepID=UPI0007809243|nr:polysaccharide biosynthesis tyrosine autokinase [Aureimonas frigidaquae]
MNQNHFPMHGKVQVLPPVNERKDEFIDLDRLYGMVRRNWKLAAAGAAVGLVLGGLYLLTAPPVYTASTRVLLDDDLGRFAEADTQARNPLQMDSVVLNQVEILSSSRLARTVAQDMGLADNAAFLNPPQSAFGWLKSRLRGVIELVSAGPELTEEEMANARLGKAQALLQQGLDAERVGRSFVIELSFRASDRVLAGDITRAYARAYLADQLDANFEATQQATAWLQQRLDELRSSSQTAALEVERFRAENGLTAARGELISEQQLSELNGQLILAQAETARAQARFRQFQSIVDSGPENAVQNATISSTEQPGTEAMVDLRQRYLQVVQRRAGIVEQFGAEHPQAVALARQEADLTQQIFRELQQLANSYRNEYEVAQSRESSLRDNLALLTGQAPETNTALVRLRELEQHANTLSTLYQTFLTRYEEASQHQSFPIAKARVISPAGNPVSPSSPRRTLTLALSLVLGLMGGAAVAGIRELRERAFRTGGEVPHTLGLRFLGYLPLFDRAILSAAAARAAPLSDGEALMPPELRFASIAPGSSMAESLRHARMVAEASLPDTACRVIGFASVLPGEGKSTSSANFAALLAASGYRTLLIDADMRNPGLSRALLRPPQTGLSDVLSGAAPWHNALLQDRYTGVVILPSVPQTRFAPTAELLAGAATGTLLAEARQHFDYVVVDLPPLGALLDARAFEPHCDAFVMVAEWGKTPRDLVRSALEGQREINSKVLGLLLAKTDMKRLALYGTPDGPEQYAQRYRAYYTEEA